MIDKDGLVRVFAITPRQLEAIKRLAEAYAKLRLSNKVEKRDAQNAINILNLCLKKIAFDEEAGAVDVDRIQTGISSAQRTDASIIRESMAELEKEIGKVIPIEDIIVRAIAKGLDEKRADKAIEYVKKIGEAHEIRRGHLSRLN